jgi:hypothetical protein
MLEFVARVFRGWMNVLLWLILIGCIIGGFVAGGILLGGWRFHIGYAVLGLVVGGIVGFITVILSGGLIANFLNMVDDISTIKYHLSKNGNISSGNSSGINSSNVSSIRPEEKNNFPTKNIENLEEGEKITFEVIDNISLLKAASDTASSSCDLKKGDQVYVSKLHKQFDYIFVNTLKGQNGWIKEKYLNKLE